VRVFFIYDWNITGTFSVFAQISSFKFTLKDVIQWLYILVNYIFLVSFYNFPIQIIFIFYRYFFWFYYR